MPTIRKLGLSFRSRARSSNSAAILYNNVAPDVTSMKLSIPKPSSEMLPVTASAKTCYQPLNAIPCDGETFESLSALRDPFAACCAFNFRHVEAYRSTCAISGFPGVSPNADLKRTCSLEPGDVFCTIRFEMRRRLE